MANLHRKRPAIFVFNHQSLLDSVVLARALDTAKTPNISDALERYETERKPRTARVQESSLANDWLKKAGNADWVYGYNAWATPLNEKTKIRETL